MKTANTSTLLEAARKAALKTKVGRPITGEEIRLRVESMGLVAEKSAVWGSVIKSLVNQNLLGQTDQKARMVSPKARGRMSPVYTRLSARA